MKKINKSLIRQVPGWDIVDQGIKDLTHKKYDTTNALLVLMAAPRLRFIGIDVPMGAPAINPNYQWQLYKLLQGITEDAYATYNALARRLVSFCNTMESLDRLLLSDAMESP